jgi:mannose-6-phosphate isomerase
MRPLLLPPNQPHRFYAGGAAIAAFRGTALADDHTPEDWVGSTTTLFGQARVGLHRPQAPDGLSAFEDGRLVSDALAADPEAFLGPEHAAPFGADSGVLVKLLDAGERLPVHAHPDRAFAARHLGCRNGKTEAWVVIGTDGSEPVVHLGFRDDVEPDTLAAWVDGQATTAMLDALHRVPVRPGDTVLVPAGTPHAIGAGVFIVELQEPTDLSVLMEWEGFEIDGRADGHLGLGMEVALQCVDRCAWDDDRLRHCCTDRPLPADARPGVRPLLPTDADPFFRAERVQPDPVARLDQAFSILVVVDGAGELETEAGGTTPLRRGQTLLVPYAAGAGSVRGWCHVVRCRPPAPEHAPAGAER